MQNSAHLRRAPAPAPALSFFSSFNFCLILIYARALESFSAALYLFWVALNEGKYNQRQPVATPTQAAISGLKGVSFFSGFGIVVIILIDFAHERTHQTETPEI